MLHAPRSSPSKAAQSPQLCPGGSCMFPYKIMSMDVRGYCRVLLANLDHPIIHDTASSQYSCTEEIHSSTNGVHPILWMRAGFSN